MNLVRLGWEPKSTIAVEELEEIAHSLVDDTREFTKKSGNVIILCNGTLLFLNKLNENPEDVARYLSEDFRNLYNFTVVPVDIGGYIVEFHEVVSVFVTENEFKGRREEIISRLNDLCFPGEKINMPADAPQDHALIGIYARGKLYRDVSEFHFHKSI